MGSVRHGNEHQTKLIQELETNLGRSVEACHSQIDAAVKSLDSLRAEVAALRGENESLRERVGTLEERLLAAEQYSRVNDVEVHGIPFKKGENLPEIMSCLGQALSYPLTEDNIEVAHRIGDATAGSRGIIVRFNRKTQKSDFLAARKVKRDLRVRDLSCLPQGFQSDSIIYINESLCPEMRKIFSVARTMKRDGKLFDAWFYNGKLFAKCHENSPRVLVKCMSHLKSLIQY